MVRFAAGLFVLGAAALTLAGPPPLGPGTAPRAPDLLFFSEKVAVRIHHTCAGCHSDEETAGRYLLVPLDDLDRPSPAILLNNFQVAIGFLDPIVPERSPLLRKALGDLSHGGGAQYGSSMTREYQALSDFAYGATSRNVPPDAITEVRLRAKTGDTVQLDGTLSSDRDDDAITFQWRLIRKPEGSNTTLVTPHEEVAAIVPDLPGIYKVALRVHDKRLWSPPSVLTVTASGSGMAMPTRKPMAVKNTATPFHDRRLNGDRLRLIRRLYYDLMWRSPRLDEIRGWYDRSHEEMVEEMLASEEMWSVWYERQLFYFLLLDRFRPKEGKLPTIPRRLAKNEITVPRALAEIVRSQYFTDRNPGNDTFVTVVLEQCIGITVQERKQKRTLEAGKKMYDGYRTKVFREYGDSQADFVRIVFRQKTFFEHFLRRTYEELHGEPIDKSRLERDASRLQMDASAMPEILAEWLQATAYVEGAKLAREKSEIPYVRGLFVDTVGRLPTYEELRNVRNAFLGMGDPTPLRLVMGRVLMDSNEAQIPPSAIDADRFVQEQFVRLFARTPTENERETFVSGLKSDTAVTPQVILWTLISSPEYQTY